jgi:predicted acylesterase/phospholipase RssA
VETCDPLIDTRTLMTYEERLTRLAHHWRMFVYVVNVCQFSLLVLIAGAALLFAGQGQDLLLSTAEDEKYLVLVLSLLMWAFSIWLWTRTLLEIRFPSTPADEPVLLAKYRSRTPRVLGLLPFVFGAWALFSAGDPASRYVWLTLLVGVLFAVFVVFRRWAGRKVAGIVSRAQPQKSRLWVDEMGQEPVRESLWTGLGTLDFAALLLLVAGMVMFLWGMIDPLSMGNYFNALVLLMAWGATFLPLGSFISYYANLWRLPFVTLLVVLALASSTWNDNHAIRPLAGDAADKRITAREALDAWAKKHCPPEGPGKDCGALVVVATAGGGIRAAYWTGTVLGHLEERLASFHDRVFAISGVSGGSVGASVYRAVAAGADAKGCKDTVLKCSNDVLSRDYLSPLSANLLYRDLLQRFIPVSLLPDRAQTLETAWERGFAEVTGTQTFSESFASLGLPGKTPWPALFLNATRSENGRRIIASTVRIDNEPAFKLAKDQLDVLGYDVRLSSAAHNSARFPFVSPAGSWHEGKGEDRTAGKILGRVQDGGLFENYGAVTALEILQLAEQRLAKRYTPVVIQISSDPTLPADLAPSPEGPVKNFAYEALTTLRTLFNTRVSHGEEAAVQLKEWAERRGRYVHFRMCDHTRENLDPPLGWALSKHAEKTIESYLLDTLDGDKPPSCRPENQENVRQLCTLLGAKAGTCR